MRDNDRSSVNATLLVGPDREELGEAVHIIPFSMGSPNKFLPVGKANALTSNDSCLRPQGNCF